MFTQKQLKTIKNIIDNRETEYPRETSSEKETIKEIYEIIDINLIHAERPLPYPIIASDEIGIFFNQSKL